MSKWYSKVSRDLNHLPDCIDYFYTELDQAKLEVKLKGLLDKASSELPGLVEQRFNQLQELEAILEYLNIELRRTRSKCFKQYLEHYQRALSSRDVDKYVDGEPDVIDMEKVVNEFALLRNQWIGIIKSLDVKGFQINNMIKLRAAGLEDSMI